MEDVVSDSRMFSAVIFDLDGTLLDTGEGVIAAVKETSRHFGLRTLAEADYPRFNGPPMKQSLMKWFGLDEGAATEATEYFRSCYLVSHLLKAKKYPREDEVLSELKEHGLRLGVATYKRSDCAQIILEHFGLAKYFEVILGDTPQSNRTKADIIRLVLEALGGDTSRTVMVGDSPADYTGAKEAGIDFIGMTYGYGFHPEDVVAPDVPLCKDMAELLTLVK